MSKAKKKIVCFIDSFTSGGAQKQMVMLVNGLHLLGIGEVQTLQYYDIDFFAQEIDPAVKRNKIIFKNKLKSVFEIICFFSNLICCCFEMMCFCLEIICFCFELICFGWKYDPSKKNFVVRMPTFALANKKHLVQTHSQLLVAKAPCANPLYTACDKSTFVQTHSKLLHR